MKLAVPYTESDRIGEAKAEAARILKLVPIFSLEAYGERIPYKGPTRAERNMAALRKAGLKCAYIESWKAGEETILVGLWWQ